jgi:hypothetical protein
MDPQLAKKLENIIEEIKLDFKPKKKYFLHSVGTTN